MTDTSNIWKDLLTRWPKEMPQKGAVMSVLNESVIFIGFALDDHFVVFQRLTPDAIGARQVILPYASICYIKITSVVPPKMFTEFGFQGTLPKV